MLIGAPASGKGTQAALLSKHFGVPATSTGVIIRGEIASASPLGRIARRHLDAGRLLPDRETLAIVEAWLEKVEDGFILDGFPRTVAQAEAFDHLMDGTATALDAAVFLDVPREVLIERIAGRLQCGKCGAVFQAQTSGYEPGSECPQCGAVLQRREDDDLATFMLRYQEYEARTEPLVPFYRSKGLLKSIDGTGNPANVLHRVLEALGAEQGETQGL